MLAATFLAIVTLSTLAPPAEAQLAPNPFGPSPLAPNLLVPNPLDTNVRTATPTELPGAVLIPPVSAQFLDHKCLADCTHNGPITAPPNNGLLLSYDWLGGNGSYRFCKAKCRYFEQNPAKPLIGIDPLHPILGKVDQTCAKTCLASHFTYSLCQERCAVPDADAARANSLTVEAR